MKKICSLVLLLLVLGCLTVSVGALDFAIDLNGDSNIPAEITQIPETAFTDGAVATYAADRSSVDNGSIMPADTTTNATFVVNTEAKVSFVVRGCRSDRYFTANLMDASTQTVYATFALKMSAINSTVDEAHTVTLKIDLKKYNVPAGQYSLYYGILDENNQPVNGSLDSIDFDVVTQSIPLKKVSFYDATTGDDVSSVVICPGDYCQLGLFYSPANATGNRDVVYTSSNNNVFTVTNTGGYAFLEPVASGTGTLTATVNGTVTAVISVTVGHNYLLTETSTAPTCTTAGKGIYQCSYCGLEQQQKIPALGHNYGNNELHIVTAATACSAGSGTKHCNRCNRDISMTIPAIFTDTKSGRYYSDAVDSLYAAGVVTGMDSTTFGTEISLTRGMLVTFLYRLDGSPACNASTPFTDVDPGRFYETPIAWAYSNGIANGISDTTFEPKSNITREQLAAFIYRYAVYKGLNVNASTDLSIFPDTNKMHNYSKTAVSWAVASGIITGTTDLSGATILSPLGPATRAQAATVLYRYLGYQSSH